MPRSPARPTRPAFTLVELLVVIAIIAILASLLAAGIFRMIGAQQDRNTVSTFHKASLVLDKQWQDVVSSAKRETPSPAAVAMAAPDPTGERARILWVKCRLMEAFPVSYAEINNPPLYSGGTGALIPAGHPNIKRKYVAQYRQKLPAAGVNPATESAACLLLALSTARGGAVLSADELGASSVHDTDGDGLKELIDGYGAAIRFYRFAWSKPGFSPDLQASAPGTSVQQQNHADPLDSSGLFLHPDWYFTPRRVAFEGAFHRINFPTTPPNTRPAGARYVIPVLASAGRDNAWGLVLPTQCPTYGMTVVCSPPNDPNSMTPDPQQLQDSKDNMYSFNQRLQ